MAGIARQPAQHCQWCGQRKLVRRFYGPSCPGGGWDSWFFCNIECFRRFLACRFGRGMTAVSQKPN